MRSWLSVFNKQPWKLLIILWVLHFIYKIVRLAVSGLLHFLGSVEQNKKSLWFHIYLIWREDARTKLSTSSGTELWYRSSSELIFTTQKNINIEGLISLIFQVHSRFFLLIPAGRGRTWRCSCSPESQQTGNHWSQRCNTACVVK